MKLVTFHHPPIIRIHTQKLHTENTHDCYIIEIKKMLNNVQDTISHRIYGANMARLCGCYGFNFRFFELSRLYFEEN